MGESKPKSFEISKWAVWNAYRRVKANKGGVGVDGESIEEFERDLRGNLYKLWNRLSSGSYFPPPVRAVEISKKDGSSRTLGVPTVISYCCVVQRAFGFVGGHASVPSVVRGERLEVLYVRREAAGRMYVCDGGGGRNVKLDEAATDRGPVPAERPLTFEVLVEVAAVVARWAVGGRIGEPVSESRTG